jgi:predicted RNA-binding protein
MNLSNPNHIGFGILPQESVAGKKVLPTKEKLAELRTAHSNTKNERLKQELNSILDVFGTGKPVEALRDYVSQHTRRRQIIANNNGKFASIDAQYLDLVG